jgi:flagellar motility protein MotE (MotC chaperone)
MKKALKFSSLIISLSLILFVPFYFYAQEQDKKELGKQNESKEIGSRETPLSEPTPSETGVHDTPITEPTPTETGVQDTPITEPTPEETELNETLSEEPTPEDSNMNEDEQDQLSDDLKYLEDKKLKALKEREAVVEKKELEITEKEKQLKKLMSEIDAKTKALVELQKKLDVYIQQISTESQERISKVVKIYENMKEDGAANVLVELYQKDSQTVIEVLKKMQPRKSGKILDAIAKIDKKVAADLSYEMSKKPKL